MATKSLGLSLATLLILFSITFLRTAYASENNFDVPLSGLELTLDLDDEGIPVGPRGQTYELNEQSAPEHTHMHEKRSYGSGQPYWYSQIKRQGKPAYGNNASYVIWRNVMDYGAKGDGSTDDTAAFNAAIADGNRCGFYGTGDPRNCDSQTTTPAIVWVPGGRTYMISAPVIMWYYTHMIGDANNLPILKAKANFAGIGILDADPYIVYNDQWYQNQNNFWRNVRNFVLDTTLVPKTVQMHGIHWQVAQASSIMNCVFISSQEVGNKHIGVFMDNGSSLFMEDLIFIGGMYGAFFGNQQFNVRNLTFTSCDTGLFQNWGWVWSYKSLSFNQCRIGLDMSQGADKPAVGSIVVTDSEFNNCNFGIITSFSSNSTPTSSATMVLDNVLFSNTNPAISYPNSTVIVPGNQRIATYIQGNVYNAYDAQQQVGDRRCYEPTANQTRIQQVVGQPIKSPSLLNSNGKFYERSKPQYEGVPVANFKSILDYCCGGAATCPYNDGVTDATNCTQSYLNYIESCQPSGCIGFVDHGAYVIRSTIQVPANVKLQGEVWPLFMFTGTNFQDQFNPVPGFRVGTGAAGERGTAEIVEILFETIGPTPGLVLLEWNLACTAPTTCGMWDTHFRIGGSNGTQLQNDNCIKNPTRSHGAATQCWAAFLAWHITASAKNALFSHNWVWIADHELDKTGKDQIDIYNGRGILVESQGPIWMYGSSSEHSQLYNYQFSGASNIYASLLQSETAYVSPPCLKLSLPSTYSPCEHHPSLSLPFANFGVDTCKPTPTHYHLSRLKAAPLGTILLSQTVSCPAARRPSQ